ncbi:hypothetical protein ACOMHN_046698 [Nucella lapillus]
MGARAIGRATVRAVTKKTLNPQRAPLFISYQHARLCEWLGITIRHKGQQGHHEEKAVRRLGLGCNGPSSSAAMKPKCSIKSTLFSSFDRTAAATRNRSGTPKRGRSKERRSPRESERQDKVPRREEVSRSASPEMEDFEECDGSDSVTADQ